MAVIDTSEKYMIFLQFLCVQCVHLILWDFIFCSFVMCIPQQIKISFHPNQIA